MSRMYEQIPSVDALVNTPMLAQWSARVPRAVVVDIARDVLGELRDAIARDALNGHSFELDHLATEVAARLERADQPPLTSAINATGIILHTGLGRAPLADEAVAALVDVAAGALGKTFASQHNGFTVTAGISPDGHTVATGGWDNRVIVWDASTGQPVTEREVAWLVRRLRCSPDGRLRAVAAWTPVNALNEGDSEPALLLYPVALADAKVAQ